MEHLDVPMTSAAAAAAVVLLTIIYFWIKNRSVLPGPKGVPYLGLYPFLSEKNVHLKLEEYKKEYGDIFSFTYSGRLFINLGSVKAIRELHINKSDCFGGRFSDSNVMVEMLSNGVTFVNGEPWKVLRKFFVQRFRDYGLNTVRDSIAGPVYDSLNRTVEELKSQQEKPVNIFELLGQRCTVTIRKIIFGEEGVTDEELGKMALSYAGALEGNTGINMLLIGPFARLLFKINPQLRRSLGQHRILSKLVLDCIKRIEKSMTEGQHPTCIIEDFYEERNERRLKNDPTWKFFTDEALLDSVLQFVGDGILSVAGTIAVLLNALVEYPDEQEKMYAEILEAVGPSRQPVAEDRSNLPYVNAFLNECIRMSTFVNFFPSLECTKEVTIRGYRIPEGSITLMNFWSSHHDAETYEEPDTFNPLRYMPPPGKSKAESPVLFGIGKRACAGEAFVMMQCYLFLATIVKNFRVVSSNAPADQSVDFLMSDQLQLTFAPRVEN